MKSPRDPERREEEETAGSHLLTGQRSVMASFPWAAASRESE